MRFLYLFLSLFAVTPLFAQLTVKGNATTLTVSGEAAVEAGEVSIDGGATVDMTGDRSALNATAVTVGVGSRLNMTGRAAYLEVDNTIIIDEDGTLNAPAQNPQIQTGNVRMLDGSRFHAPSFEGEVFVYEDFRMANGSTFTAGGYVELSDINWDGEVIFLIGGDAETGLNSFVLAQEEIRINGQITTQLVDGYAPTSEQTYRLIELDDQFTEAGFTTTAPSNEWTYDIEQNYVDVLYAEGALPLEWLSFTGQWRGKTSQLNWATANEVNTRHFDVERQDPAGNWTAIGQVAAAGTSPTPNSYEFLDADPGPTNPILYRLRQVDLDGTFAYSDIVALTRAVDPDAVNVYPNPARDHIFVEGLTPGPFRITDAAGREIANGMAGDAARVRIALPAGLPVGTYVIRRDGGEGRRFVVVR